MTQIAVKIVMIALENKVALTFNNPVSFVESKEADIKTIFEKYFPGWMFTDDSTREADIDTRTVVTIMDCHFVDYDTYEPILNTQVKGYVKTDNCIYYKCMRVVSLTRPRYFLSLTTSTTTFVCRQYDLMFTPLSQELQAVGLILDPNNGIDVGQNSDIVVNEDALPIVSIVLIIVTSILAIMFIFLVIAYYIRVKGLERRVKANATLAVDETQAKQAGMLGQGEALPGTNAHTNKGG